jgi:hypothetical protein
MEQALLDRLLHRFTGFPYYKLVIFCFALFFSYEFFAQWGGDKIVQMFSRDHAVVTAFVGGIFYAFGFTAPIGAGMFLSFSQQSNVLLLAIIGGLGALTADFLILKLIRISFQDEFDALKKTPAMEYVSRRFSRYFPERLKQYVLIGMAGVFIASPLPDEIGVSLLAGLTHVKERTFIIVSFLLNTAGILVFLLL